MPDHSNKDRSPPASKQRAEDLRLNPDEFDRLMRGALKVPPEEDEKPKRATPKKRRKPAKK